MQYPNREVTGPRFLLSSSEAVATIPMTNIRLKPSLEPANRSPWIAGRIRTKDTNMKTMKSLALFALLTGATSFTIVGCKTHEHMESASTDSYPLTKCVVSGEDLGDK